MRTKNIHNNFKENLCNLCVKNKKQSITNNKNQQQKPKQCHSLQDFTTSQPLQATHRKI
ncbi:hypothetical protein ACFP3I_04020 [Chryseobacterium arachidis]|uniref:hypothetical protein n=1 Tax=Chryseobacterium arachidis TaxID=1416778 RepID=UPI00360C2C02